MSLPKGQMENHLEITTEACLIIPDMHQDIRWVQRILKAERNQFSHLVLLGDYFDAARPDWVATPVETAEFLLQLKKDYPDKITFLLGNHDIHYLEARRWTKRHQNPSRLFYKTGGYTHSRAKKINDSLPDSFWQECRLFAYVNGHLISHAGVAGKYWHPDVPLPEALGRLQAHCDIALEHVSHQDMAFLSAGHARGGSYEVGGITWMDWDTEFCPTEVSVPQIVGHTGSHHGARQKGQHWCIDGHQNCYALLNQDGERSIRYSVPLDS